MGLVSRGVLVVDAPGKGPVRRSSTSGQVRPERLTGGRNASTIAWKRNRSHGSGEKDLVATSTRAGSRERMSTHSSDRSPSLATALVAAGAILSVVWFLAGRSPVTAHSGPAPEVEVAGGRSREEESLLARTELAPAADLRRTQVAPASVPLVEQPGLATLNGRLQVDGFAPYHGRVVVREVEGERSWTGAIDRYGRFFVPDVPAAELSLSFEMEWNNEERQLLLPSVPVTPAAGAVQVVDLDWTTRHVNVTVVDDVGAASPARVELSGPNYAATLDTNERGKARLSLIGGGSFSFRARLPSGR